MSNAARRATHAPKAHKSPVKLAHKPGSKKSPVKVAPVHGVILPPGVHRQHVIGHKGGGKRR